MKLLRLWPVLLLALALAAAQNFISPTFMGMHSHNGAAPSSLTSYRFWDSGGRWAPMNPSYGSYSFSWMDSTADYVRSKGATVFIYTFADVPSFAQTSPSTTGCAWGNGTCSAPIVSDFTAFVSALAQHSAARKAAGKLGITHYEMWNEPNASNFWRGTTPQMVALAKAAYPIIHQYDPSAKVSTPAPQGTYAWQWLQGYFSGGGAWYSDTVNYHGYLGTHMPEYGMDNVNRIKALMTQYGLSGKPLINSENYWWGYTGLAQSQWLARKYILDASQGVSMNAWYGYTFGGSLSGNSNFTVYSQMKVWLVGCTVFPATISGTVYQVAVSGTSCKHTSGVIAWNTAGSSSLGISSSFHHYTDVWGGVHTAGSQVTISQTPILVSY